jgi:MraZ protein
MLLTGTFPRSLDEKLRITLPKRLRDAAGEPEQEAVLYITPATDGSLALYTEQSLNALAERLEASASREGRTFSRLFYSQAQAVEIDGQGRIRIPTELAQAAGLDKEVVLVGVQDHMELWDRSRWDAWLADKLARFDEFAEAALNRPSPAE